MLAEGGIFFAFPLFFAHSRKASSFRHMGNLDSMELVKSDFLRRREVTVRHFDRYSPDARRALSQAREVALRLNHKTICTEHLLCGLLEANDPVVSAVLSAL